MPAALLPVAVSTYLATMPWREQIKTFAELYSERRDALLESLADLMPPGMTWTHPTGGLFVWVTLPEGLDSKAMMPRAIAARVAYVPGTGFYADGSGHQHLPARLLPSRRPSGSGRAYAASPESSSRRPPCEPSSDRRPQTRKARSGRTCRAGGLAGSGHTGFGMIG